MQGATSNDEGDDVKVKVLLYDVDVKEKKDSVRRRPQLLCK